MFAEKESPWRIIEQVDASVNRNNDINALSVLQFTGQHSAGPLHGRRSRHPRSAREHFQLPLRDRRCSTERVESNPLLRGVPEKEPWGYSGYLWWVPREAPKQGTQEAISISPKPPKMLPGSLRELLKGTAIRGTHRSRVNRSSDPFHYAAVQKGHFNIMFI